MQDDPPRPILTRSALYPNNKLDLQVLIDHLVASGTLEPALLKSLLLSCRNLLRTLPQSEHEPNLIELHDPITIIGDIHGQFFDLLKVLSYTDLLRPQPDPNNKVLFLGDYVDRGLESLEVATLLIAIKLLHPNKVVLLRGNHETRAMTEQYNFMEECLHTYSQ